MAWRQIGDKPLSESMRTRFTDAYVWQIAREQFGVLLIKFSNCLVTNSLRITCSLTTAIYQLGLIWRQTPCVILHRRLCMGYLLCILKEQFISQISNVPLSIFTGMKTQSNWLLGIFTLLVIARCCIVTTKTLPTAEAYFEKQFKIISIRYSFPGHFPFVECIR